MKVTLINPDSPFLINPRVFPPLGILYIASVLEKSEAEVTVIDLNGIENWKGELDKAEGSGWIGVSATTPQFPMAKEILKSLKETFPKTPVAIGGPHPTVAPKDCEDFDLVVVGEGEFVASELSHGWRQWALVQRMPLRNLDDIPFPARHLIDLDSYHYFLGKARATNIMSSRGCSYNCSFCVKNWGYKVRFRSPGNVLEEAGELMCDGFEGLMFFDDEMLMDRKRDETIFKGLKRLGLTYRCFTRSNLVSEVIARILEKTGCHEVLLGIESGSDRILRNINKGTTRKMNLDAIKLLKKHGVRVKAAIIIGLPGESEESIAETESFVEEAEPDDVDFTLLQVYPGSDIYANPKKYDLKWEIGYKPYKGVPGQYNCTVSTSHMTGGQLLFAREMLEKKFKNW